MLVGRRQREQGHGENVSVLLEGISQCELTDRLRNCEAWMRMEHVPAVLFLHDVDRLPRVLA